MHVVGNLWLEKNVATGEFGALEPPRQQKNRTKSIIGGQQEEQEEQYDMDGIVPVTTVYLSR